MLSIIADRSIKFNAAAMLPSCQVPMVAEDCRGLLRRLVQGLHHCASWRATPQFQGEVFCQSSQIPIPSVQKGLTGLQATVVNQLPGGLAGPIVAGNAAWTTNRHSQQDLQRKLWSSNSAWRLQSNTSREGEQHQIRTETGKGWYWRFRKASELLRHVCGRLDPSRTKATFSPRPHLKPWAHTIPYQNHLQTGRL